MGQLQGFSSKYIQIFFQFCLWNIYWDTDNGTPDDDNDDEVDDNDDEVRNDDDDN